MSAEQGAVLRASAEWLTAWAAVKRRGAPDGEYDTDGDYCRLEAAEAALAVAVREWIR